MAPRRDSRPAGRTLAVLGLATTLTLTACGGDNGDDGESYTWSLGETHPDDYPTTLGGIWFTDELRERTDGRIDITSYPNAQLGEERDVLEQVQMGAVEMTRVSSSPVSEFVDEWGVFSLPYIFDDADHMWRFLESDYAADMLDGLREGGFVGLAYYEPGARNFYTSDTPIESPEDLAGQNIRVIPGAINTDMIEAMGGSPVSMDYGEVYGALESGVIDGAENNEPSFVSSGHYETAPHFTRDGHQRVPEVLLINADLWDSLSDDDQELMREVAQESIPYQRDLWDTEVEESIEVMEDAGVEVYDVDVTEFQDAVADMVETYRDEYGDVLDAIDEVR